MKYSSYIYFFIFFLHSYVLLSVEVDFYSTGFVCDRENTQLYEEAEENTARRKQLGNCDMLLNLCTHKDKLNSLQSIENNLYEDYVNVAQNHEKKIKIAFVCSVLSSLMGVSILGVLSYNFAINIGGGPVLGWILALTSPIPPLLGFSAVSYKWFESLILLPCRGLYTTKLNVSSIVKELSIAVPALVTTLPLTFLSYDHISSITDKWAYLFACATTISFYFYYHKTTSKIYSVVYNFYLKRCTNSQLRSAQNDPIIVTQNNATDYIINKINEKLFFIDSMTETLLKDTYYFILGPQGYEIKKIISLDSNVPSQLNDHEQLVPNKEKIVGYTGAIIALFGSYYFYDVSKYFVSDLLEKNGVSYDSIISIGVTAGLLSVVCRGIFSIVSCYEVWINIYRQSFSQFKNFSGIAMLLFACIGAIPSTEIALEYVGHTTFGYFITVATAITVFSEGYWGLNLHKNRFSKNSGINYKEKLFEYLSLLKIAISNATKEQAYLIALNWKEYE